MTKIEQSLELLTKTEQTVQILSNDVEQLQKLGGIDKRTAEEFKKFQQMLAECKRLETLRAKYYNVEGMQRIAGWRR